MGRLIPSRGLDVKIVELDGGADEGIKGYACDERSI
jgi:hypothetical protein